MKKILLIYVVCFLSLYAVSQNYANHWIDYSQRYYRIPITSEGVYRVTYADLFQYGISAGDFDPRNLQIIHNGKVLPLFVFGENDGVFHASDFFEFYAPGGNTGWLDTAMYKNTKPLNPEHSLYNDTASYFLTFANTLQSTRYDTIRQTNYSNSAHVKPTYCIRKSHQKFTSTYNAASHSPYIMDGEGWCDAFFNMGETREKIISTPNYVPVTGVLPKLRFGVTGSSETRHDLFVEMPKGNLVFDTVYYNYGVVHKSLQLTSIAAVNTVYFKSSFGNSKPTDKNSIAYVEIEYPHSYNFQGSSFFSFDLPYVASGDYILLEIVNFDGGAAPIMYCPDIHKRIQATKDGSKYQVLIPNPKKQMRCVFASQSAYQTVPKIISVKTRNSLSSGPSVFHNLTESVNQGDYIIITHSSLWTQANLYRNMRNASGSKAVIIDIQELYNQFAFGIHKHPYAISAFLEYATKVWGIKPEHVFLIGKGYHVNLFRNNATIYANTLLPVAGYPSSDVLFTTDFHGKTMRTNIAIGRLSARNNTEVEIYRKKVVEHEQQIPAPWMKNVLHFGGGTTAAEKKWFKTYLSNYESVLRDEHFGADVFTFLKESSDVFEKTEPELIRELMNQGTAMLNFFGHASGIGFDQNIDHPSLFSNQGKYPLMLANSCYSGDIFTASTNGISETWMFTPDRGSIAFIANVDLGLPTYLDLYAGSLVRNIARNNYGNSIGSSIQLSMHELSNKYINYQQVPSAVLSYVLHGDPAVKVHSFPQADLALRESSLLFLPTIVSNDLPNFSLSVVVHNYGKVTKDTCTLRIVFTSESGKVFAYDTLVHGFYLRDTFVIDVAMKNLEAGNYKVMATIDAENVIDEIWENNNSVTIDFFISSRDVMPVYPYNFAIIPKNTVELVVSAVDPMNAPSTILMEIDTSALFNSPLLVSTTLVTNNNSVVSWNPGIELLEHTVYFWRVTNADSIKWNEHSFVYEADKNGWAQIHAHQFILNDLQFVEYNESQKKHAFFTTYHEIFCQTMGSQDNMNTYYLIDGSLMGNQGVATNGVHVAVIDSISMIPWLSNKDNYGQLNYPTMNGLIRGFFIFTTSNATSRANLAKFLRDSVPHGNHVLVYSYRNPLFQDWEESLHEVFDELGASLPRVTPSNIPYILITQKGNPAKAVEKIGDTPTSVITLAGNTQSHHFKGTITSPYIGPSHHFQEFVWLSHKDHPSEQSHITIRGKTLDNSVYTVESFLSDNHDRLDTLVKEYEVPYLQLENFLQDNALRTPSDLDYWKVYYDPIGELAVTPEYKLALYNDTLQQGDKLMLQVSAKNVGAVPMDSVLVLYEIRNSANELVYIRYQRTSSVNSQAYVLDDFDLLTNNLQGNYTIKIEFNPINPETGVYDQLETYRFNNVLYMTFYVQTDKTKPVLDVIVDGRHVIDGDIISARPQFFITLYDENKYLPLQDTSVFKIFVTNIQTGLVRQYYFTDSLLTFIPAEKGSYFCYVLFSPHFTENGLYELSVQAVDASGNFSGIQPYIVRFTIQIEQKISVLYNFPNPCKEYTTFRFVLSGTEVPDFVAIQVFTVQGDLVKEIHGNELGTIYIGTNSIDLFWDGRDAAGKLLPNGVYPYRLVIAPKREYTHLPTEHDEFMNVRYGRMIIER